MLNVTYINLGNGSKPLVAKYLLLSKQAQFRPQRIYTHLGNQKVTLVSFLYVIYREEQKEIRQRCGSAVKFSRCCLLWDATYNYTVERHFFWVLFFLGHSLLD